MPTEKFGLPLLPVLFEEVRQKLQQLLIANTQVKLHFEPQNAFTKQDNLK